MDSGSLLAIVLKTSAPELVMLLAKLLQSNYNTDINPTMWEVAQMCSGHKKQDNSIPANYCFTSLLSIIREMMEGVIKDAIKQHLLSNNLLTDAQFGFRQGRLAPDLITAL
eukprot:g21431.t1